MYLIHIVQKLSLSLTGRLIISLFSSPVVLLALMDRMGDAKDQVREQAQNLILKLMDKVAPPMV